MLSEDENIAWYTKQAQAWTSRIRVRERWHVVKALMPCFGFFQIYASGYCGQDGLLCLNKQGLFVVCVYFITHLLYVT